MPFCRGNLWGLFSGSVLIPIGFFLGISFPTSLLNLQWAYGLAYCSHGATTLLSVAYHHCFQNTPWLWTSLHAVPNSHDPWGVFQNTLFLLSSSTLGFHLCTSFLELEARTVAHFSQSSTPASWTEHWAGAAASVLLGLPLLTWNLFTVSRLGKRCAGPFSLSLLLSK